MRHMGCVARSKPQQRVLEAFADGNWHSSYQLCLEAEVVNPTGYISELRAQGYTIVKKYGGTTARGAEVWLYKWEPACATPSDSTLYANLTRKANRMKTCSICGQPMVGRHHTAKHCLKCYQAIEKFRNKRSGRDLAIAEIEARMRAEKLGGCK